MAKDSKLVTYLEHFAIHSMNNFEAYKEHGDVILNIANILRGPYRPLNPGSYAICGSDLMIKGEDVKNSVLGNTLGTGKAKEGFVDGDVHPDEKFHCIVANPPFGVEWMPEKENVTKVGLRQTDLYQSGSGLEGLTFVAMKSFVVPHPDMAEQAKLVERVELSLGRLEALLQETEDVVARLNEYHSALITAATTGKIDVRGVKVPIRTNKNAQGGAKNEVH